MPVSVFAKYVHRVWWNKDNLYVIIKQDWFYVLKKQRWFLCSFQPKLICPSYKNTKIRLFEHLSTLFMFSHNYLFECAPDCLFECVQRAGIMSVHVCSCSSTHHCFLSWPSCWCLQQVMLEVIGPCMPFDTIRLVALFSCFDGCHG